MVHSSDGGEGPPHYQLRGAAVQPAENAREDAGDEDDPVLLQVGVAVKGPGQRSLWGDKHARASRGAERRRAGVQFS
jgi:hypothetical protein